MFSLENWPEMVKLEGSLLKEFTGPSEKKKKVAPMVKCIRQAWDQAGLQAQALGHQGWRCGAQGSECTRGLWPMAASLVTIEWGATAKEKKERKKRRKSTGQFSREKTGESTNTQDIYW